MSWVDAQPLEEPGAVERYERCRSHRETDTGPVLATPGAGD